jgi:hypothetical protein
LRLQHRAADDILRGDQLDLLALARQLVAQRREQRRVAFGDILREKAAVAGGSIHVCPSRR